MINLLKSTFKQKKVELFPTGIWFVPMRIDDAWTTIKFVYSKDFFDE